MTPANVHESDAQTTGWMVSFLLHGGVVLGAFLFMQQVQLAPQPTPFRWNVAMVTSEREPIAPATPVSPTPSPLPAQAKPAGMTAPAQPQPATPSPDPPTIQTVQPPTPVTTATPPPAPSISEPIAQARPAEPIVHEHVRPRAVEPTYSTTPIDHTPAHTQIDRIARTESQAMSELPPPTLSPTAAPPDPTMEPTAPPAVSSITGEASVETASASAVSLTQVAAVASASVGKPAKMDYRWLADTILRRVEELKRYPAEARLDRAEGKVVVKAVIRDDGSVGDVEIFQSSGFRSLDQAAMELMKQAAPFPLAHPLGKSNVTVKIPMSYRLDR